jgi:hypothetical protein
MDIKIGAIPTMPSRIKYLLRAAESLEGQLDRLYICLNGFESIPAELENRARIFPYIPEKDYGSIGRFLFLDFIIKPFYYFCADDDLYYPPDYVSYLITKIDQYRREAAVTLHGRILADIITHWNSSRKHVFPCLESVYHDVWAHLAGTGVLGFHSDTLDFSIRDFPHINYDDYEFSILLQKKKIPILIAAHEEGFLKYLNVPSEETIFYKTMQAPDELTAIAKSIKWKLYSLSC